MPACTCNCHILVISFKIHNLFKFAILCHMLWIFSSIFSNKKNILKASKNDNSFTRCLPSPTRAHPFDLGQNDFASDIFSWLPTLFSWMNYCKDAECHCNHRPLLAVSITYVPKLVISRNFWTPLFAGLRLTLKSHQCRQILFLYFKQFNRMLSDMRKEISSSSVPFPMPGLGIYV